MLALVVKKVGISKLATRSFSLVSKCFGKYDNLIHTRPILTKCITSAAIGFTADIICQVFFSEAFQKSKKLADVTVDFRRTLHFTAIAGLLSAPVGHFWYRFIFKQIPGTTVGPVLKRLFFDQVIFAPVFLPFFFSLALTLEGKSEKIPAKLENDLIPTLMSNYVLWLPAQFVNFKYVPTRYNVLFANFVGFFWSIYLSYACYSVDPAKEQRAPTVKKEWALLKRAVTRSGDGDEEGDSEVDRNDEQADEQYEHYKQN